KCGRVWTTGAWTMLALSLPLFAVRAADPPQPTDQRSAIAEMQARQAALPDTPGTGRFPAMKEEVASLPDHVIYRPAQLERLGSQKLGLYIFGNGACSNDGASARLHLLEVASHGYLAVAPGRIRSGPGATVAPQAEAPRPTAGSKLPTPPTTAADLLAALDWALAQNEDARSPFYRKIDKTAVAFSGFSCGGLQALQIASDP